MAFETQDKRIETQGASRAWTFAKIGGAFVVSLGLAYDIGLKRGATCNDDATRDMVSAFNTALYDLELMVEISPSVQQAAVRSGISAKTMQSITDQKLDDIYRPVAQLGAAFAKEREACNRGLFSSLLPSNIFDW